MNLGGPCPRGKVENILDNGEHKGSKAKIFSFSSEFKSWQVTYIVFILHSHQNKSRILLKLGGFRPIHVKSLWYLYCISLLNYLKKTFLKIKQTFDMCCTLIYIFWFAWCTASPRSTVPKLSSITTPWLFYPVCSLPNILTFMSSLFALCNSILCSWNSVVCWLFYFWFYLCPCEWNLRFPRAVYGTLSLFVWHNFFSRF